MCWDSAAETVGRGVIRVTWQPLVKSVAARRRKGTRWPIPAEGKRAICGGESPVLAIVWWLNIFENLEIGRAHV